VADHYVRPGWFTTHVFNRVVAWLTHLGISLYGSRVLAVRGRSTGEWRTTPVNLLHFRNERYLVAPRGVTQWVRNVRAGGEVELRVGRRSERVRLVEVADADKPAILRAYLQRWAFEVGMFFDGVGSESPDVELRRIAPRHPVFRITQP
jgi:deazaflavin-dependent oxidoreductase (nitroreductase family)